MIFNTYEYNVRSSFGLIFYEEANTFENTVPSESVTIFQRPVGNFKFKQNSDTCTRSVFG